MVIFRKKSVVIAEIGSDWLKIAENVPSAKGGYISKIGFVKLSDAKEKSPDRISAAFKNMRLSRQYVITYIPRHLVTVRTLELPSTDPKEIKDMVELQVSRQTPYSKDEIVFTHRIIGTDREGYSKVMLIIARRNVISERVGILRQAGIEIKKVAVSSEGVYSWFKVAYPEEMKPDSSDASVLIDIDSNYSDFIVIRKGRLVFTRNMFIGTNHISEKKESWQDSLIGELRRSLERYQAEERGIAVTKIFLSGAARNIDNLDRDLSQKLGISAEYTDPFRNIRKAQGVDTLQHEGFKFVSSAPLIGTALRHTELQFELTPGEDRIQRVMEEKKTHLTIMGILFASIVMMASLLLLIYMYGKNAYLYQIRQKISQVEDESNEIEKMRMRIELVEKRLDAKGSSINILNEIHSLTPEEIYFMSVNIEEKKTATLRGSGFAMSDVFKFVTTLENSDYFENVKTTYTTTKKEKGREYADFEIICGYEQR